VNGNGNSNVTEIGNGGVPQSDGDQTKTDNDQSKGFPLWLVIIGIILVAALALWFLAAKRRKRKEEQ
jgi:LPXTG-motif cell wall-anchored protein